MSILFIANEFPPGYSDMREYNYRFAESLKAKTELVVLTLKSPGWKAFDSRTKMEIIRAGDEARRMTSVILLNKRAAKLAISEKYDHIIASGWETAGAAAMNISTRMKIPFSLIISENHIKKYLSKAVLLKKLKSVIENAAHLFCLSERTSATLRTLGIKDSKILIIHAGGNPLEPTEITNDEIRRFRGTLSLGPKDKLIVSAGRLERKNAFDILLWSIYMLRQRNKHFKLLIIGGGPEEKRLKQIISDLHLEDCVAILPMPQRMDAYLKACDVYIQLGRAKNETAPAEPGLRLLEAGYYAKPVIAAESCELSELVKNDAGLIVPPLLPVNTAAVLEKLFSNEIEMKNIGKASAKKISENYTWEGIASKVINTIRL
jgi:glycosyltransferase involved in cell wall biosynthesis